MFATTKWLKGIVSATKWLLLVAGSNNIMLGGSFLQQERGCFSFKATKVLWDIFYFLPFPFLYFDVISVSIPFSVYTFIPVFLSNYTGD